MDLVDVFEAANDVVRSKITIQAVQTVLFATLGVLSFYYVLDVVGLEEGPFDPFMMLFLYVLGLTLGAAVFLSVFEIPYSFYLFSIVITVPWAVMVREHLVHGPAGVSSPVTLVFAGVIVAALLLGGGAEVAARHLL